MFFRYVDKIADRIWAFVALILVLLAIYVGVGRQLVVQIADYRQDIERLITNSTGLGVSIAEVKGEWALFTPIIEATDVTFFPLNEPDRKLFSSVEVAIEVDVLSSLVVRQPRLRNLRIVGLDLVFLQHENGDWSINGYRPKTSKSNNTAQSSGSNTVAQLVLSQRLITLMGSSVTIVTPDHPVRTFKNINAQLHNSSGVRDFDGNILLGGEQSFAFSAKGKGNPFNLKNFELELYGKLDQGSVFSWLPGDIKQRVTEFDGIQLQELSASGEIWAHWKNGKFYDVNGVVAVDEAQLSSAVMPDIEPIKNLIGQFDIETGSEDQFILRLDHFQFDWRGDFWRESQVKIMYVPEGEMHPPVIEIFSNYALLRPMVQALLISGKVDDNLSELLSGTQFSGELENTSLRYYPRRKSFRLSSNFKNISAESWRNLPQLSGLSGFVEITPYKGWLSLNSSDATIWSERLLRKPIHADHISGAATWQMYNHENELEEVVLKTDFLKVKNPDTQGEVAFTLSVPFSGDRPRLKLIADVFEAKAEQVSRYLPATLPTKLLSWLDQSITAGTASGVLVYNGPIKIKGLAATDYTIQSDISFQDLSLDYQAGDWPPLEQAQGRLLINAADISYEIDHAKIFDSQIMSGHGGVGRDEFGYINVDVNARVEVIANDLIRLLNETPIEQQIGGLAQHWQARGSSLADINLTIPLSGPDREVLTQVNAALNQFSLHLTTEDLVLDNIRGQLFFDSRYGLYGEAIKCETFGYPAQVNLPKLGPNQKRIFQLNLVSEIDIKTLNEWARQPILDFMTGQTDYEIQVVVERSSSFVAEKTQSWVRVLTQLEGVEVNIPKPLYKAAAESRELEFRMSLAGFPAQIMLQYGEDFSSALLVDAKDLLKAQFKFDAAPAILPAARGIYVEGSMASMDWDLWEAFFVDLGNAYALETESDAESGRGIADAGSGDNESAEVFVDRVKSIDLNFRDFVGYGLELENLEVHSWREDGAWVIYGKNPMLDGRLKVPDDDRALEVQLSRLQLQEEESSDADNLASNGNVSDAHDYRPIMKILPAEFPNMVVRINDFSYGDMNLGKWNFNGHWQGEAYQIDGLRIRLGQLMLEGNGSWQLEGERSYTKFEGQIVTEDIGQLMQLWGYPSTIETKSADISYNVSWPYSPVDFDLDRLQGDFALKLREGRFLEVDAATSAVRVLGILNFSNMGRRLRLDFKDLYQSGLQFDRVKGPINLSNGVIGLTKLDIEGPSAKIIADGEIDYIQDRVNMNLELSLPFSENLIPVMTIVAGPLAGGGWYILDKVIGKQFDKIFSLNYGVTGTMAEPRIQLRTGAGSG